MTATEAEPDQGAAWHQLAAEQAAERLGVEPGVGLADQEATSRRARYGPNELAEEATEPLWQALLRQYQDFMQLLLLAAAVISIVIGQRSTGALLILLTVVNAMLGYRQEAKAEKSLEALKQMMQVEARVLRDGAVVAVPAEQLVPGDVFMVEAGDQVPADGRLVRAATLEIEESALTGESQPAAKGVEPVPEPDAPLGDRASMVYMNTLVTRGTGTVMVTSTGMATEMGKIADMLASVETERSPLQKQMDGLAKLFAWLAGAAIVLMVIVGLARGVEGDDLFLLAISVAIAAVPTGLPTIVTGLLSAGTQELAERNAIVKSLTSVETLGSTTAICSDKTGTLTLNQMTVRVLGYGGNTYRVGGEGYATSGAIKKVAGTEEVSLEPILVAMALCSDAALGDGDIIGDPTEGALVVLAEKGGIDVAASRDAEPRLAEVPFDSAYKLMATFHDWTDSEGRRVVRCFVKGAPGALLQRAADAWWEDRLIPIDRATDLVLQANDRLASQGLRVLTFGQRDFPADDFDPNADLLELVADITLIGMVGIVDPPRPEAKDAIAVAHHAGIEVRMITGDHAATASAIAGELGIPGIALTGADIDDRTDDEFASDVEEVGVFGRVAPEHKVRLVRALKQEGHVVAMTGDGVNDAPALKTADIGVAMGITGTEVSKQAATMILTDDNFATIVDAVEQGRVIYDNLVKYIRFQLSSLVAFITTFVGAGLFNIAMGSPLSPLQILFINFVITVPPALGLGRDTPSPGLMDRRPRPPGTPIVTWDRALRVGILGVAMAIGTLGAVVAGPDTAAIDQVSISATMGLVTLSLGHIVAAISNRSELDTIFSADLWSNPKLLRLLGTSLLMTVLVTELGFLQQWFGTVPLTGGQWGVCLSIAVGILAVGELRKLAERRYGAWGAGSPSSSEGGAALGVEAAR